jgi:hypothetical protein
MGTCSYLWGSDYPRLTHFHGVMDAGTAFIWQARAPTRVFTAYHPMG